MKPKEARALLEILDLIDESSPRTTANELTLKSALRRLIRGLTPEYAPGEPR